MPAAIGEIARFARMLRRARQDHVEERTGRKRREEIGAHGGDAVVHAVGARVLDSREGGVRIDVGCYDVLGAGACRRERKNA